MPDGTHMLLNWNEEEILGANIIFIDVCVRKQHVRFICKKIEKTDNSDYFC